MQTDRGEVCVCECQKGWLTVQTDRGEVCVCVSSPCSVRQAG